MNSILEIKRINKSYKVGSKKIQAIKDVSFRINKGECLGIVGESGCGKSTIARIITRLETVDTGEIILNGKDITYTYGKKLRKVYKTVQMVFQSPIDSFNPRHKLGDTIKEGLINQGMSRRAAKHKALEYLRMCGLSDDYVNRYPHQVSGGECQRASIARALALKPKLLICDEPTSALDVTTQAQIIKLMVQLKKEMEMAFLFISHDIALVQEICDRILVVYQGQLIEEGTTNEIIMNSKHVYTKRLIDAVLDIR